MSNNRDWMYDRVEDRAIKQSYANGVIEFIQYAFSREGNINAERIKCPCTKCQNIFYRNRGEVELHLMNNGFIRDYKIWYVHGESDDTDEAGASNEQEVGAEMEQMILNAAGPDFDRDEHPNHERLRGERPNPEAQAFMEMLHAADEELWDGAACSREKKLSAISLLLNLKSDFELSEVCYNRMISIVKNKLLPKNNRLPSNYYESKRLVNGLGLGCENIHMCPKNCMLYYGEYSDSVQCHVCKESRYKEMGPRKKTLIPRKILRYLPITPRLKRLYMSPRTAPFMTWHKDGHRDKPDMITHPSDAEGWKHFDAIHNEFASEPRNVRLGLSTDGHSFHLNIYYQVNKSIFWDLPYWSTLLVRHNLDVMHIEKNVFDNIFNTIMDIREKTKDNAKARLDMALFCKRPTLELQKQSNGKICKPKAMYCLNKNQKVSVCNWIKELKFPDGYAANWSRSVKVTECKFHGLKSHDCHIFMQRLMPVAFRNFLPNFFWEPLTELSNFFRDLCSTELKLSRLLEMEKNVVVTLCKLEQFFPPSFFDSMEHLIIHLAYEAPVKKNIATDEIMELLRKDREETRAELEKSVAKNMKRELKKERKEMEKKMMRKVLAAAMKATKTGSQSTALLESSDDDNDDDDDDDDDDGDRDEGDVNLDDNVHVNLGE